MEAEMDAIIQGFRLSAKQLAKVSPHAQRKLMTPLGLKVPGKVEVS